MNDEHATDQAPHPEVPNPEASKPEASKPEAPKPPKRLAAVSLKVSEKGGLSVYGLGRFPVTLYREQWEKLLGLSDQIKAFIEENKERLKTKEQ